jgi:2-phosphoglycerate kinase
MNKKELEKYIATRPSAKESDGAWKRLQDQQKQLDRLEKFGIEQSQHPRDKYFEEKMEEIDKKGTSYLAKHLKKSNPTLDYIKKTREEYNDPILENRGKQTLAINHTANKYLNNHARS